jgi:hypothetical protein
MVGRDSCDDLLALHKSKGLSRVVLGSHYSFDLFLFHLLIDDSLREESALCMVERRVVFDLLLEVRSIRKESTEDKTFINAGEYVVPVEDGVLDLIFFVFQCVYEGARR